MKVNIEADIKDFTKKWNQTRKKKNSIDNKKYFK